MRRPKSPKEPHTFTLRLPDDVIEALDDNAKKHKMYRNELIESYLRYAIENESQPRFPMYEFVLLDWLVIYDRLASRLVVVGIDEKKPNPLYCHYDNSNDCVHVEFAKSIPIIHDIFKARKTG